MNILIKLTCLVGLAIAPILGGHFKDAEHSQAPTPKVEQGVSQAPVEAAPVK